MSSAVASPMILLLIVLLAVIFFAFGLVHLLVRYLMKNRAFSLPSRSDGSPDALRSLTFQRQLQHLFRMHDSGLDQAIIEALPVFHYKEINCLNQPFDCAVCLSEFSDSDRLKLLVNCSHAFHIHCIETWLLSNSTCPLCRGLIGSESRIEKQHSAVRLGKFRSSNNALLEREDADRNVGSSSIIDARRCYSMGAFQYVMSDAELQVTFSSRNGSGVKFKAQYKNEHNVKMDGEKIDLRSRGDSLSVSKIWLWAEKGELPSSLDTNGCASLPFYTLPRQSE